MPYINRGLFQNHWRWRLWRGKRVRKVSLWCCPVRSSRYRRTATNRGCPCFTACRGELAEKWKPAYELSRCPYEVFRTDQYDQIVCDDMFKLLVWDCYAWSAWQFFQVKDRKGNYRDIPGTWMQYAGYFPLWRLSYRIIPYIRMKFEPNGLGFQNLYNKSTDFPS